MPPALAYGMPQHDTSDTECDSPWDRLVVAMNPHFMGLTPLPLRWIVRLGDFDVLILSVLLLVDRVLHWLSLSTPLSVETAILLTMSLLFFFISALTEFGFRDRLTQAALLRVRTTHDNSVLSALAWQKQLAQAALAFSFFADKRRHPCVAVGLLSMGLANITSTLARSSMPVLASAGLMYAAGLAVVVYAILAFRPYVLLGTLLGRIARHECPRCHFHLAGIDSATESGTPIRCPECGMHWPLVVPPLPLPATQTPSHDK
jgi:hypothetical protein